jgi:hypothetical protein
MMKVATNGQKVKAPALLFCNFLPLSKMKKWLKMDEKVRL